MSNRLITGEPSGADVSWRPGNPVGSRCTGPATVEDAYFVGPWRADGYTWSSSIGISNTDGRLARWTADFLTRNCGPARVRWRVYLPPGAELPAWLEAIGWPAVVRPVQKAKQVSYHVYVNHRPFLRQVRGWVENVGRYPDRMIRAYFAGRFDGDGCVGTNSRWGARVVYGGAREAEEDRRLLMRACEVEARVYEYRAAKTFVLYVLRRHTPAFLNAIQPFSIKLGGVLDPVETEFQAAGAR